MSAAMRRNGEYDRLAQEADARLQCGVAVELDHENLTFDASAVLEAEWRDAHLLAYHLFTLAELVRQYHFAVLLVRHCEGRVGYYAPHQPEWNWAIMAGSHAAFTLYHYRTTLNAIEARLGACRSIVSKVDTKVLAAVKRRFAKEFPDTKNIRDAVGHFADRMFHPDNVDEHSFTERGLVLGGQIFRGDFVISHKKDVLRLPMDTETFEKLQGFKREVYEAFGALLTREKRRGTSRGSRTRRPAAERCVSDGRSAEAGPAE